ncbi:hypothetical protein OG749_36410 [Streptomyces nojiriensis]|uniref:hypothetical protein n=1 Tax=Streptomyces nojiriensis TaxID=66374 RepID=UPI002E192E08
MTTPTPRPKIPRPVGVLLVKSAGGGRSSGSADDNTVFAVFPNGAVRRLTSAEANRWEDATVDYLIPVGKAYDGQWLDLVAYDNAIRA